MQSEYTTIFPETVGSHSQLASYTNDIILSPHEDPTIYKVAVPTCQSIHLYQEQPW